MAKARAATKPKGPSVAEQAIAWYRSELEKPAPPPETHTYPPVTHGPTWRVTDGHWELPERTLGWQVLGWTAEYLQLSSDEPWVYTLEQARFVLWWYAVNEDGKFLFKDCMFQRLKGWGKDPLAATLCAIEAFGPCRFGGWDDAGQPIGVENPKAWVQTAAVSLDQTKNTMTLFPLLITEEARVRYGISIGKTIIHGAGGRRIEAVTSSPGPLEGARASLVILNETHHWKANNEGHEMAAVIRRNAVKSADGAARTIRITNAYEPSDDSVAQRDREAWEMVQEGRAHDSGLMLDSLEAPPEAPLTAEAAPDVVTAIRGDSVWLSVDDIVAAILDVREPPSQMRRFWYNQIVAAEDAWVDPQAFTLMAAPDIEISPKDEMVLFFDGSKSDDATALMGCRMSDGHAVTLGMWQRPPGTRGQDWIVPRGAVDQRVTDVFDTHRIAAFWADPSHVLEDETQERFWDAVIDEWHRRYKDRLRLWAVNGARGHSIMWDMTSSLRLQEFVAAAELTAQEIDFAPTAIKSGEQLAFTHDGDGRLVRHVRNAKRFPTKYGTSLWKGHRESPKKVDLAVALVGARMLRRNVLNLNQTAKKPGKVWFPNAR